MARLVKTVASSDIICNITTYYENGSSTTRQVKANDIIEEVPLRYVENKEVKSAIGRVLSVSTVYKKLTPIDMKKPVDNFAKDFNLKDLRIDSSEKFVSNVITVNCNEIVEDQGVTGVKAVHCTPLPIIYLDLTYTDDTTVHQEIQVDDVLEYVRIKQGPGKPDIEGCFKVAALGYTRNGNRPKFDSLILTPYESTGKIVRAYFENIISFEEIPSVEVTDTTSLASVAAILASSESGKAEARLGVDVNIPPREDGRITTLMIGPGKELDFDLNGHNLSCEAYAFYVNGGTLNIYDDTNESVIEGRLSGKTYPMIQINADGVCNMFGGTIDTTAAGPESEGNWLYGAVCSGNGIFNMKGGKMIIQGAAGIAITNGTASGEGAVFTIGGDSEITSIDCASVYLADNKSVIIEDNALLNSGIVARMGDVIVRGNATINSITDVEKSHTLGSQVCFNGGVDIPKAGILALTGVYGSSLGNDMNISIQENAKVNGFIDDAIDIAFVNTKYDQNVTVTIDDINSLSGAKVAPYRVYTHDELAELATEAGKTLGAETNTTNLRITVGNEVVYPPVDGE